MNSAKQYLLSAFGFCLLQSLQVQEKIQNFNISTGKSRKNKNNHENVSQFTIQIHIKRPKKLKNGRLTKQNCYKAAV